MSYRMIDLSEAKRTNGNGCRSSKHMDRYYDHYWRPVSAALKGVRSGQGLSRGGRVHSGCHAAPLLLTSTPWT